MNELYAAVIAAGAALLSSIITGFISYKVSTKAEKISILKKKLSTAYHDISSFYQLEVLYTEKIAELEGSTTETIKRSFREKLRNEGYESPSRYSTPSHIVDELRRYES